MFCFSICEKRIWNKNVQVRKYHICHTVINIFHNASCRPPARSPYLPRSLPPTSFISRSYLHHEILQYGHRETGSINIGSKQRFICSKPCYFAPKYIFNDVKAIYSNMDRIRGSRSWLDTFHLKQTVQTIMHRFLELYQDFEWKYQTVYCLYVTESTVWCKAKNVSANSHGVLQMKRFI